MKQRMLEFVFNKVVKAQSAVYIFEVGTLLN